jgi:iron(III) transport system ATP-binding protein
LSTIEFVQVSKRFGATTAVADISFSIDKGELVTFLGPSGCGKTTCLRLIAGLDLPSFGQVLVGGRDVSRDPAFARNIGMVFQSYALFPHMSVLDNAAYSLVMRGVKKRQAQEKALEILSQVGLDGLHNRYPGELSGGQQQRVAVARAIIQQPEVLLFDEPLSNVDAKLRRRVRLEIRELQRRFGLTAVYVTHDQEEALAVSDRIVVMQAGRIAQIGTAEDLYHRPANPFVAGFIGDANLLEGELRNGSFHVKKMVFPHPGPDGPATFSLRPERIRLCEGEAARVLSATFLGSRMEYLVEAGGEELLVSRPIAEPRFAEGGMVDVEVLTDDLTQVF